ncbi:FtsX-like permease family protein [Sphingobacterium lactis]|uniref:ABC-type antimicrobial peptide transport system, permease component n=1 Tax=Sphingobacterium lactis TaxID=797291 RepID=A0A1H5RQ97_9SPHI|nr:FtsX-like permease family protein [Sphingobacterium lactis]SEF39908.1 ABC-type antimicrobial peptide transport system, permease component [Sphingobacterium lactis]
MINQLIKNSIRQLRRNPLFSALNILGLTIGISSCWVIYKYVSYEMSYEKGIPQQENVYRLLSHFKTEDRDQLFAGVSRPIYFALQEDPMGLDKVVPYFRKSLMNVTVPEVQQQERKFEEPDWNETAWVETTADFFSMVPYHWLAGNQKTALQEPHQLVLTEKRAKHYFPNSSPEEVIGRTIIYNDTIQRVISGVVANLDFPSEYTGQEFSLVLRTERDNMLQSWGSSNGADKVYFIAKDAATLARSKQRIQAMVDTKWKQIKAENILPFDFTRTMITMPIAESHFATDLEEGDNPKTSKRVVYGLIAVAGFLLLLACINYINLSTAQMPQRYKEIGIRKTLGGSRGSLIAQMMIETGIIVCIASVLSYFVGKIGFIVLGDLISEQVKNYSDPPVVILSLACTLIVTMLLAGLYPSWLISKVNAVEIFRNKGHVTAGSEKINLRKALIVFQFIIAQIFIVGAIIIGQQLHYVINKDMGFKKDAVLLSNIPYKQMIEPGSDNKKMVLADEIRNIPGVLGVTMGDQPISNSYSSNAYAYRPDDGKDLVQKELFRKNIDTSYLQFYGLKLLAGKTPIPADTANGYVINASAMAAFGFKNPTDAVGKFLTQDNLTLPITGVVQDFHTQDFYTKITPLILMYGKGDLQNYSIRLDPDQRKEWPAIIEKIKTAWSVHFPADTFSPVFYDDSIAEFYNKEQQLYKLTNISTAIAILISCLGLFGLATLTAFQRSKEIGIRKVLGASVSGIVAMLSKDFVKMVIIAMLIAAPIVWWACSTWLEGFVYRIEISWTPFILGGLLAVLAAVLTISYQAVKAAKANPVDSLRDE